MFSGAIRSPTGATYSFISDDANPVTVVDPSTGDDVAHVDGLDCLVYDAPADAFVPADCGDRSVGAVCVDREGRTEGDFSLIAS